MTRDETFFRKEVIEMIKLWEKESKEHSERSLKEAGELKLDSQLKVALKMIYSLDAFVQVRLQALFTVIGSIMYVTNTLGAAIDQLPVRDDFDSVKKELEGAKKVIEEAVVPVKKLYDDAKEREKRGEGIYE